MQQTADADVKEQTVAAKDQTVVDVDLETILVSGLSFFSYVVAEMDSAVADVAMTAVCGLSSYYSAVADLVVPDAVTVSETTADATTDATRIVSFVKGSVCMADSLHIFDFRFIYCFDVTFSEVL